MAASTKTYTRIGITIYINNNMIKYDKCEPTTPLLFIFNNNVRSFPSTISFVINIFIYFFYNMNFTRDSIIHDILLFIIKYVIFI